MHLNETDPPIWYAAGRIGKDGTRFGLVNCEIYDNVDSSDSHIIAPENFYKSFRYSGPYTVACDHGCSHASFTPDEKHVWRDAGEQPMSHDWRGTGTHGSASSFCVGRIYPRSIMERSCDGIRKADCVFVWIEDEECFGTLVEIGYAVALKKRVYVAHHPAISTSGEMWFAFESATKIVETEDPGSAWLAAILLENGEKL